MKLHWYDRLFMVAFTLACIIVALCLIIVTWIPVRVLDIGVDKESIGLTGQAVITAVALAITLGGVRYFMAAIKGDPQSAPSADVLLRSTDSGVIRISVAALDSLVQKCVKKHTLVRDVRTQINVSETGDSVTINLRIVLMPDAKAPEVGEALQNDVKAYVEETAGMTVHEVLVFVDAPNTPSSRVG